MSEFTPPVGGVYDLPTPFRRPDKIADPLHVLIVVFNSQRFRVRWKHAYDFLYHCENNPTVVPWLAEVTFGERDWAIADENNPRHLRLRSFHEIWVKENAYNLLAQRLPHSAKYIAWLDADIAFTRQDWANETIHKLQHHPVVQMFSQCQDLSVDNEIVAQYGGFANSWVRDLPMKPSNARAGVYPYYGMPGMKPEEYPHPGFAWATWRSVWDRLGGLIDHAILGSADWYMAWALAGDAKYTINGGYHQNYKDPILEWENRARTGIWQERPIMGNLGVVPGLLLHYHHGPKRYRRYKERNQILAETKFDPYRDLKRDSQGLYQLTVRNPELRREVQKYFAQRNEDDPCSR